MADNDGQVKKVAEWMVSVLAALQYNSKDVFRTTELWKHQIAAGEGGTEAFSRYQPFAFINYQSCEGAREGGKDLRQIWTFAIAFGVESKSAGVAKWGDANNLGTTKIRELIISAFDKKHPGSGFDCDEFYYIDEVVIVDGLKQHAIQMHFEASKMT